MFKKILLASARAVSASFAGWDSFQVLENHKGQARIGLSYTIDQFDNDDNFCSLQTGTGVRYTVIPNLELALSLSYHIFTHHKGKETNRDGFQNPIIGIRYHFIPTMNVYARVSIPVGDKTLVDKDAWGFNVGAEFYTPINPLLNFGSRLAVSTATKGEDKKAPLSLTAAAELNFMVTQQFNPYIGMTAYVFLGTFTEDGYRFSDGGNTVSVLPQIGASYAVNEIVSFTAEFGVLKSVHKNSNSSHNYSIISALQAKFNF